MVERAPLRPVPRRPTGPLDPELAVRQVAARLPSLDPLPRDALALVTLAGRTRGEAAARLRVGAEELALALAAGRKELRRCAAPMAASGWCERAELLVSDRLDGELDEVGAARLDVHLRNCPRCVEHERRLVQALDGLVGALAEPAGAGPERDAGGAPAAPLRLAAPQRVGEPAPSLGRPPIPARPFGAPVAPASAPEPPGEARVDPPQPPVEPGRPTPGPPQPSPPRPDVEPPAPAPAPREPDVQPPEPAIQPPQPDVEPPGPEVEPREPDAPAVAGPAPERAVAAALEPARRSARELVMAGTWHLMFALALVLAVATVAIAVWGALGGEL